MGNIQSMLLLAITILMLPSVANCDIPNPPSPYVFSPPKWIMGSWQDTYHRFTPVTFHENDIYVGENSLSKLYAPAKETSDKTKTSENNTTYTIILANSTHTFTKTSKSNIIEYSFVRIDTDTSQSNITLKKISAKE